MNGGQIKRSIFRYNDNFEEVNLLTMLSAVVQIFFHPVVLIYMYQYFI